MIINIDSKHIYNWKTKQRRYIVPKNVQIVLGYPLVLVPSPPPPHLLINLFLLQESTNRVSQCWNLKAQLKRKGLVKNGKSAIKKHASTIKAFLKMERSLFFISLYPLTHPLSPTIFDGLGSFHVILANVLLLFFYHFLSFWIPI